MIVTFYMIIAFLVYIFFTYIYIKKMVNQYINEELKIIAGLKNKKDIPDLSENIKTSYNFKFFIDILINHIFYINIRKKYIN